MESEVESVGSKEDSGVPLEEPRIKSSLRMHYEAQATIIDRQLGGLEGAREKLGLSQRKMAQLLMVDPSAWTRWAKGVTPVPTLIWRALQWYMILQEKIPGLTPNYFLGGSPDFKNVAAIKEMRNLELTFDEKLRGFDQDLGFFKTQNQTLTQKLDNLEKQLKLWRIGTMILTTTLIFSTFIWVYWYRMRMS